MCLLCFQQHLFQHPPIHVNSYIINHPFYALSENRPSNNPSACVDKIDHVQQNRFVLEYCLPTNCRWACDCRPQNAALSGYICVSVCMCAWILSAHALHYQNKPLGEDRMPLGGNRPKLLEHMYTHVHIQLHIGRSVCVTIPCLENWVECLHSQPYLWKFCEHWTLSSSCRAL